MASRQMIERLCGRIDKVAERIEGLDRRPLIVVEVPGEDLALRAAAMDPSGRRPAHVVDTGVPGAPDAAYCTRESVAAALPRIKAMIAGQRALAERDKCNDFGAEAAQWEDDWLALCRRFALDYAAP